MNQSMLARNHGVGSEVNNAVVGAEVEAEALAISHVLQRRCRTICAQTHHDELAWLSK